MSNLGSGDKSSPVSKGSKFRILIVLVAVIVALGLLAPRAISMFSSAPDFPGPGSGSVQLQIEPGATLAKIGNDLKALGVVALDFRNMPMETLKVFFSQQLMISPPALRQRK